MRYKMWASLLLMFLLCTLISMAALSFHMKFSGGLSRSPSTVSEMFFTLVILALPFHLVELILIYTVYYMIIRSVNAKVAHTFLVVFMVIFGFIYFYLVQAFLGGIVGDVENFSFLKSFERINYFYFYVTIVYIVQINLSFLLKQRQE